MFWLRLAYCLNLLILIPVCANLLTNPEGFPPAALQGKFNDSAGLRMLVFSLWSTILLGSIVGLFLPLQLRGLLWFQVTYKSIFLASYVAPRAKQPSALPNGLVGSFVFLVPAYLMVLWLTRY